MEVPIWVPKVVVLCYCCSKEFEIREKNAAFATTLNVKGLDDRSP